MAYNCCCWGSCFRTRVTWLSTIKCGKTFIKALIFIQIKILKTFPWLPYLTKGSKADSFDGFELWFVHLGSLGSEIVRLLLTEYLPHLLLCCVVQSDPGDNTNEKSRITKIIKHLHVIQTNHDNRNEGAGSTSSSPSPAAVSFFGDLQMSSWCSQHAAPCRTWKPARWCQSKHSYHKWVTRTWGGVTLILLSILSSSFSFE